MAVASLVSGTRPRVRSAPRTGGGTVEHSYDRCGVCSPRRRLHYSLGDECEWSCGSCDPTPTRYRVVELGFRQVDRRKRRRPGIFGHVLGRSRHQRLRDIVGYSCTPSGFRHPVLFRGTCIVDLGTLGGDSASAAAISERGHIVGTAEIASGVNDGFFFDGYRIMDAGMLPGGNSSHLTAVSSDGFAVGHASTAAGEIHAVLYRGGELIDLNTLVTDPSWVIRDAVGINDCGLIAANAYYNGERSVRAVLLERSE
jgi:probable HAF family extracellular repeat protein